MAGFNRDVTGWGVHIRKAWNSLHTAQHAYDKQDFDSCASRAYFTVFHSEIAALHKLTAFRQGRWGHDHVQAEFNRRLIRARKLFPASLRTIHNDLIGVRHIADYTDRYVSERTASRCLARSMEMVTTIAGVLEEP